MFTFSFSRFEWAYVSQRNTRQIQDILQNNNLYTSTKSIHGIDELFNVQRYNYDAITEATAVKSILDTDFDYPTVVNGCTPLHADVMCALPVGNFYYPTKNDTPSAFFPITTQTDASRLFFMNDTRTPLDDRLSLQLYYIRYIMNVVRSHPRMDVSNSTKHTLTIHPNRAEHLCDNLLFFQAVPQEYSYQQIYKYSLYLNEERSGCCLSHRLNSSSLLCYVASWEILDVDDEEQRFFKGLYVLTRSEDNEDTLNMYSYRDVVGNGSRYIQPVFIFQGISTSYPTFPYAILNKAYKQNMTDISSANVLNQLLFLNPSYFIFFSPNNKYMTVRLVDRMIEIINRLYSTNDGMLNMYRPHIHLGSLVYRMLYRYNPFIFKTASSSKSLSNVMRPRSTDNICDRYDGLGNTVCRTQCTNGSCYSNDDSGTFTCTGDQTADIHHDLTYITPPYCSSRSQQVLTRSFGHSVSTHLCNNVTPLFKNIAGPFREYYNIPINTDIGQGNYNFESNTLNITIINSNPLCHHKSVYYSNYVHSIVYTINECSTPLHYSVCQPNMFGVDCAISLCQILCQKDTCLINDDYIAC